MVVPVREESGYKMCHVIIAVLFKEQGTVTSLCKARTGIFLWTTALRLKY